MHKYFMFLSALLFVITGCATSSLNVEGVNRSVLPQMVQAENIYKGNKVLWGGIIIKTDVLKNSSQIEVLAYPVNENGVPMRSASAQGRFIIIQSGFLEPADYAAGRWVSVVGTVTDNIKGKVGEADYTYPAVQAQQLERWSESDDSGTKTRFHFGIGISL